MRKILLLITMIGVLGAASVQVPCSDLYKAINAMKEVTTKCEVDTDIHYFKQELDVNTTGAIKYLDDDTEVPFSMSDNFINVGIKSDRKFIFKVGDYTSQVFKLSLRDDGSEWWRYVKPSTGRLNTYKFSKIITKVQEPNTSITLRILLPNGSPAKNMKVEAITPKITYTSNTNSNGQVFLGVPKNKEFLLRVWNTSITPAVWGTYPNKMRIEDNGTNSIDVNGTWEQITQNVYIQDMSLDNRIQLILFKKGYGNCNVTFANNSEFKLNGDKRIAVIATYPFKKGVKYKFDFNEIKNTASDKGLTILLRDSIIGKEYQVITKGDFVPNKDYSMIQIWNRTKSTSPFVWEFKNISLLKYL